MIGIQNFSSISACADRVLLDENAQHGPALKESTYTFKDKAVFFLAKIPLLKDISYVKEHINKLDLENKAALGVFLNALSKCYGTRGAMAVAEALKGPIPPLNAEKIKQLSSIAQDLYGRGDAKPLARQAVVRIWPNTKTKDGGPLKGNVGHASITVKNKMQDGLAKQIKKHISWWPGASAEGSKKDRFFAQRPGRSLKDYAEDKRYEIADRTVERLMRGEEAAARLKTGDASPQDRELAKYIPRANQKKDKDGKWGVVAQKVYFPLVGRNKETAQKNNKSFTLFGLNEKNIIADGEKAKADAGRSVIGYTLASKTENCAAMVARMLKSGGAENFSKFNSAWISEDPNKIHAYAKTVQIEVDKLNNQTKTIEEKFHAEKSKNEGFRTKIADLKKAATSPHQEEISNLKAELQKTKNSDTKEEIKSKIKSALDKQTLGISAFFKNEGTSKYDKNSRSITDIRETIHRNAPSSKDSFDTLTAKAKEIVKSMDLFLQKNSNLSDELPMETLISGQSTLDKIKEFIEFQA